MRELLKKFLIACITLFIPAVIYAQRTNDIENSKDHTLINRFKGSVIEFYKETQWGAYKLPVNDKGMLDWENPQELEGKVTRIQYSVAPENNSEFVLQNYKKALTSSNLKILIAIANEELGVSDRPHTWGEKYYGAGGYYNGLNNQKFGVGINLPLWKYDHSFIAAKGNANNKDIHVIVYTVVSDGYTLITQDVIEIEGPETGLVTVNLLSDEINSKGHVAIYDILFETGQSFIKPESEKALQTIAEYIQTNSGKKYYIVGHTDNVGDFNLNLKLSVDRAHAVLNALTTKYNVNKEQLSAHGVSSLAPVASNTTEEGRAQNRRVEIVEQ